MKTLSPLKFYGAPVLAVALYPAACFALVPALPAVKAIELPPPNVTAIAAKELAPFMGKPVAALELKSVVAVEAPYGSQVAQPTQVASNEQNNTPVSPVVEVPAPETAAPAYAPMDRARGDAPANYNPQTY